MTPKELELVQSVRCDGFLIHGSANSTDLDVLYFVKDPKQFPSFQACTLFCRNSDELVDGKTVNRNICLIEDHVISKIFKGNEDEANNAMLRTFPLHQQVFENPVQFNVERVVMLKTVRAFRALLTWFTKNKNHRLKIKEALRSFDFSTYRHVVEHLIDISNESFHSLIYSKDAVKSLAFQLGQTLSLIRGTEVYTKNEIAEAFPDLKPMLMREDFNTETFAVLEKYKKELVAHTKPIRNFRIGSTSMSIFFCDTSDVYYNAGFLLHKQVNGVVLEMKPGVEFCVYFPNLEHATNQTTQLVFVWKIQENLFAWSCRDLFQNSFENSLQEETAPFDLSAFYDSMINQDLLFTMNTSKGNIHIIGRRNRLSHKTLK